MRQHEIDAAVVARDQNRLDVLARAAHEVARAAVFQPRALFTEVEMTRRALGLTRTAVCDAVGFSKANYTRLAAMEGDSAVRAETLVRMMAWLDSYDVRRFCAGDGFLYVARD